MGRNPDGRFVLRVERVALEAQLVQSRAFQLALRDYAAGPPDPSCSSQAAGSAKQQDTEEPAGAAAGGAGRGPAATADAAAQQVAEHGSLGIIESHGDCVLELPPGAVRLAGSSTAQYEIWALRDNVLAIQVGALCPVSFRHVHLQCSRIPLNHASCLGGPVHCRGTQS